MTKLRDYSGKFDPDFGHNKLSRDALLKLLKGYSEYILRIDGHWYLTVMQKWGNDAAFDCDVMVWEKLALYEMRMISSLLNIYGDDVVTVMKAMQVSPWMWTYECATDIKSNDHAITTCHNCPTLLALEKEGKGREKLICQELEPKLMGIMAHFFNPDIKVTPLKLPPRKSSNEICCQWEFKLER